MQIEVLLDLGAPKEDYGTNIAWFVGQYGRHHHEMTRASGCKIRIRPFPNPNGKFLAWISGPSKTHLDHAVQLVNQRLLDMREMAAGVGPA